MYGRQEMDIWVTRKDYRRRVPDFRATDYGYSGDDFLIIVHITS